MHLLPLGATEPHGPHAPLATDTLISVGICRRAAERLDGEVDVLVLPAVLVRRHPLRQRLPGRGLDRRRDAALARDRYLLGARAGRARQQPPRAGAGLDASRARPAAARRHAAGERRAPDRRVPLRRGPRGPVRDLARARRSPRPGRRRRGCGTLEATWSTCRRRSGPGRRASSRWAWIRRTAGAPAEATAEEGERTFETLAEMLVELIREVAA